MWEEVFRLVFFLEGFMGIYSLIITFIAYVLDYVGAFRFPFESKELCNLPNARLFFVLVQRCSSFGF